MGSGAKQDLSSFMCILIMTIGCLTILLVANTLIIASNPDNLQITSIFDASGEDGGSVMKFGNKTKDPSYVDVTPTNVVVYPGGLSVDAGAVDEPNNAFDQLLDSISTNRAKEYVVLILRPGSALFSRQLRKMILKREIDVGIELYETDQKILYKKAAKDKADGETPPEAPEGAPDGEPAAEPGGELPPVEAAPTAGVSEEPAADVADI